jgi:hypothetical protein
MSVFEPSEADTEVQIAMRLARPVPSRWREVAPNSGRWRSQHTGVVVIESVTRERDGRRWHHVSLARSSRLPTWEDVRLVRADFIGEDRESYQVFPPDSRWVNDNKYVLHLWCCLDAPDGVLPDFRHRGTI